MRAGLCVTTSPHLRKNTLQILDKQLHGRYNGNMNAPAWIRARRLRPRNVPSRREPPAPCCGVPPECPRKAPPGPHRRACEQRVVPRCSSVALPVDSPLFLPLPRSRCRAVRRSATVSVVGAFGSGRAATRDVRGVTNCAGSRRSSTSATATAAPITSTEASSPVCQRRARRLGSRLRGNAGGPSARPCGCRPAQGGGGEHCWFCCPERESARRHCRTPIGPRRRA